MFQIVLNDVEVGVMDGKLPPPSPDLPPLPCKLLRFVDKQSGIIVDIPLPNAVPPGGDPPEGWEPPAVSVGKMLLDNKPVVEVASVMPPQPPPGKNRPRR